MTPNFKVLAAGVNITKQIKDRLLSLTINDEAGGKADAVEIRLDDRDGAIELPFPGAPLVVLMGYKERILFPMGVYTADEVSMKGPPASLTIRGKSANMGGSIKDQKTRNWDEKTIKQIVEAIADEHGLEAKIAKEFQDFKYEHIDQTDESDMNFLTRIGKEHDAIVTVKGDTLLFTTKGAGITVSGLLMPVRPIQRRDVDTYNVTLAERGKYKSVTASWHDKSTGKKETVTAGDGSPTFSIRHSHATKEEAEKAAKAKLDEMERSADKLSITMGGDPLIAAEGRVALLGFRIGVNGVWSIKSVKHTIANSGFKTTIEGEKPKD